MKSQERSPDYLAGERLLSHPFDLDIIRKGLADRLQANVAVVLLFCQYVVAEPFAIAFHRSDAGDAEDALQRFLDGVTGLDIHDTVGRQLGQNVLVEDVATRVLELRRLVGGGLEEVAVGEVHEEEDTLGVGLATGFGEPERADTEVLLTVAVNADGGRGQHRKPFLVVLGERVVDGNEEIVDAVTDGAFGVFGDNGVVHGADESDDGL